MFSALPAGSCARKPADQPQDNVVAPEPERNAVATIPISAEQTRLQREQLIFASIRALSANALGTDDAEAQKELKGREFELRLRFGCANAPSSTRTWTYDEKKHVARAHVDADLSAKSPPASDLLLKGYEGIVGFTIERPLLLSPGCPAPQFAGVASSGPTIAIAQLFTSDESRVQRPGESFEVTKALEPAEEPTEGLDLVISGRLAQLSDGRVIHCSATDGAPACIIAAKFDRVTIENPVNEVVLGQWSQW